MNCLALHPSILPLWKSARPMTEQGDEHEKRTEPIRGICREESILEIQVQMIVLKPNLRKRLENILAAFGIENRLVIYCERASRNSGNLV